MAGNRRHRCRYEAGGDAAEIAVAQDTVAVGDAHRVGGDLAEAASAYKEALSIAVGAI